MLIDDIRKENMEALKRYDADARSAYSIVISRYLEKKSAPGASEPTDQDVLSIIQKLSKELDEEKEGYLKVGSQDRAEAVDRQKAALTRFLPKQLSEEEIRKIIEGLEDKSIPSVMKHFKTNYQGQVDMGLVSRIAKTL